LQHLVARSRDRKLLGPCGSTRRFFADIFIPQSAFCIPFSGSASYEFGEIYSDLYMQAHIYVLTNVQLAARSVKPDSELLSYPCVLCILPLFPLAAAACNPSDYPTTRYLPTINRKCADTSCCFQSWQARGVENICRGPFAAWSWSVKANGVLANST